MSLTERERKIVGYAYHIVDLIETRAAEIMAKSKTLTWKQSLHLAVMEMAHKL